MTFADVRKLTPQIFSACLLEATARKAGNVHPGQSFVDTNYLDFVFSARAISSTWVESIPADASVGQLILDAVRATVGVSTANTNLGIVLLLAPLVRSLAEGRGVREVRTILQKTTVDDARLVYEAIRLAHPGGLGQSREQDIRETPTQTLGQVMCLAGDRDLIARQYQFEFADVFDLGLPAFLAWLARSEPACLEMAIMGAHLELMAARPDSLIARKLGDREARESARQARRLIDRGWPTTRKSRLEFARFDRWLRESGNQRNPGATADLIASTLFVALVEDRLVMEPNRRNWIWTKPDLVLDPRKPA